MWFSVDCALVDGGCASSQWSEFVVCPKHFDHCNDAYSLSMGVQTTQNHIRFVKFKSFSLIFSMINYVYLLNPIKPLRYISSVTKIRSWMSYFNFPKISKWSTDPYKFLLFFVLNGCEACNSVCIDSSTLRTGNSLYCQWYKILFQWCLEKF